MKDNQRINMKQFANVDLSNANTKESAKDIKIDFIVLDYKSLVSF